MTLWINVFQPWVNIMKPKFTICSWSGEIQLFSNVLYLRSCQTTYMSNRGKLQTATNILCRTSRTPVDYIIDITKILWECLAVSILDKRMRFLVLNVTTKHFFFKIWVTLILSFCIVVQINWYLRPFKCKIRTIFIFAREHINIAWLII